MRSAEDNPAARETLERMGRALALDDDGQTARIQIGDGGLAARAASGHASLHREPGLAAAVEGPIAFRDGTLDRLAREVNPAAAVIAAYRRYGRGCLERFHGGFAVALHDFDRQTLLIAIDRAGIRPLCYAPSDGGLAYGTHTDAVLAKGGLDAAIDPQGIFNYLYFHVVPAPGTAYRGISKLLPGEYALWQDGRLEKGFYWHLHYDDHNRESFAKLKERFRLALRGSVERAAATDGGIGAFLSGGTDSSTVTGILTEIKGKPAETFSIGFEAEGFDEMSYARIAARRFGSRPHEYYLRPDDIVSAIPLIAQGYDEPFGNDSAVPTYFCAKLAREHGIATMLAGDGGDEIFGGNARYAKQKIFEIYGRLSPASRRAIERLAFMRAGDAIPKIGKLRSYIRQASVPLPERMESYNFLQRHPLQDIFEPDFLGTIDPDQPHALLREVYRRSDADHFVNRMMHLDLKFTLADNDLRKVGRMCEMAGVEVRFPLLDDELVEFSGQLPVDLKVKGSQLRYFFKRALQDVLPKEIIAKRKHGFGLPFGVWANTHEPLRDLVEESLAGFARRGWVRPSYLAELRQLHRTEHATYYGVMVWVVVILEQWLQAHRL